MKGRGAPGHFPRSLPWPIALAACAALACAVPAVAAPGFIRAEAGRFLLDGTELRFEGTNNYYLLYQSDAMVDDVIDTAAAMGLRVLRLWAFFNGDGPQNREHDVFMQSAPGVYGPPPGRSAKWDGFERLDHAVARAAAKGLHVILVAWLMPPKSFQCWRNTGSAPREGWIVWQPTICGTGRSWRRAARARCSGS